MDGIDIAMNEVTKSLGLLLRNIDKNVAWVDYLPLESKKRLVAVGFKSGKTKYADVSGMDTVPAVRHVMGCLEDVRFECQFLNTRQMEFVRPEIYSLATDTAHKINSIYEKVRAENDPEMLKEIVEKGANLGCLPDLFAVFKDSEQLKHVLLKHITSGCFSTVDAYLLTE